MFSAQEISNLNELESEIFKYINLNREKVANITIRELASQAHVSTTSILRLCKKFNCKGFSEFKIKLKIHIENQQKINGKDDKSIYIEFLEMIEKDEYKELIKKSIELIKNKSNFWIMGCNISKILANYGAIYFTQMGKMSSYISDPSIYKKYNLYNDSVTIVLSVLGEEEDLIKRVKFLRYQGGKIISLTNSKNNTIANLSDVNISYYSQLKSFEGEYLPTQMPVMYLLEKIAQEYIKN